MEFFSDYDWLFGFLGGGLVIFLILILGLIGLVFVANWILFKKAGRKGWESIIPIYSTWVLTEISGLNWWWFLLLIADLTFEFEIEGLTMAIGICGFLARFNCYYNISRRFGKDRNTSILAGLFSFIFIFIFAFSKKNIYDINIPVSANGIFGSKDNINSNDNNIHHQYNSENMYQSTTSVDGENNNSREYSFCGNCGMKLDKEVNFCPKCGHEKK